MIGPTAPTHAGPRRWAGPLASLLAGALFGVGLEISGMTRATKVIAFLDVGGAWDPSLALVMLGAIAVHFSLIRLIRRRSEPLFDTRFHGPAQTQIDARLVVGAALFGVGWGLGGFCPGPALVSSVSFGSTGRAALLFVVTMAVGMRLARLRSAK